MRLLLVNPRSPESFWNFRWGIQTILPRKRAINPPLGLATLAALCPAHWQVTIVDENVEPLPLRPQVDLIGIAGMGVQFGRQAELLRYYRNLGYYVVAGGSYASLCPDRYAELADSVICGEAESIWPEFCRDFEAGRAAPLYRETGSVDLRLSPAPRFDLLKLDLYSTATVQFSRGCPYLCEFCDIIVMFGRRPRHKTPQQIGHELDRLREAGVRSVFFVDDNLIGHRKAALDLLRYLREYQARHRYKFSFGTEASLNLAQDSELLTAFRDANFKWVFVGIESPDHDSLKETRKLQNVGKDAVSAVQTIHASGIAVLAGFIIGFDNDSAATFDAQYDLIMRAGIQAAMVGLLHALPRTPLYERLRLAGRLRDHDPQADNTRLATNVVPLRMSYDALVAGYKRLCSRLLSDQSIAGRIVNKHRHLRPAASRATYGPIETLIILARLVRFGLLPGGIPRIRRFLHSLPWRSPRAIPSAIEDWVVGLSMRDYVERHFGDREPIPATAWNSRFAQLAAILTNVRAPRAAVAHRIEPGGVRALTLSLHGWGRGRACARAARLLRELLADSRSQLRVRVLDLRRRDLPRLRELLAELADFGDRVTLEIAETLHGLAARDLWNVRLALPEGSTRRS